MTRAANPVIEAVQGGFEQGILPITGTLVLGLSGGQDSLALAHALADSRPRELTLVAVHVDHGLRASSVADVRRVRGLARQIGCALIVRRYDVRRWADRSNVNIEAAARSARYRLLSEIAARVGAGTIATAHTATDQVETVLLHLLRGSGLEGLAGLQSNQTMPLAAFGPAPPRLTRVPHTIHLVRPLLTVERWETAAYCTRNDLAWVNDLSNDDRSFTRNRIRQRLIPLLETYNPSIRVALRRLATLAHDDAELIASVVDTAWEANARLDADEISFPRDPFLGLHRSVSSRLLRRAAATVQPGIALSFEAVDRCLRLAHSGVGVTRLSPTLEYRVEGDRVTVLRRTVPT